MDFPNPASFEGSQPASIRPSGRVPNDRSPKEAWEGFLIAVGWAESVTHSDTHLAKCLTSGIAPQQSCAIFLCCLGGEI